MRVKVRLDTLKDVNKFVALCTKVRAPVYLIDGAGLRVSAKSVLGVTYSLEFEDLWCECEEDIYSHIEAFII